MRAEETVHLPGSRGRWISLFVVGRGVAAAVAVALLLAHRITEHDGLLAVVVALYAAASIALVLRFAGRPFASRWLAPVWLLDALATLGLVLAAGDWRSPFYLIALTALILPVTTLPWGRAVAATALFTLGYFAIALTTGVDWNTLESTPRLESFATHLMLPLLLGIGLAYASRLLRRLDAERERSERLVLEAERRRIARDLHDSAKQRVQAARLVLSSGTASASPPPDAIALALRELETAVIELDDSVTGLRADAARDGLVASLRERAAKLEQATGVRVAVDAEIEGLEPAAAAAAHVYYVVSEAMVNAAQHARASSIRTTLTIESGLLVATVVDDGRGLPVGSSWGSHGVRSMVERAELLGGRLVIGALGGPLKGTRVRLEVPLPATR